MEFNPFGSTAASLGSALGKGLANPIEQAMELLGQKKLAEIQSTNKHQLLNQERNQQRDVLSKHFGNDVAELILNMPNSVQASALSNPMGLFDLKKEFDKKNAMEQAISDNPELKKILFGEQDVANIEQDKFRKDLEDQSNKELESVFGNTFVDQRTKLALAKDARQEEDLKLKRSKALAPLMSQLAKEDNTARSAIKAYDNMEELTKKGDLNHPLIVGFADLIKDKLNLDVTSLLNADTQTYKKIENDFVRNIKGFFPGGRITDFDLKTFMKTIPTLYNSPEGRLQIIKLMRAEEELKSAKYDLAKELRRENPTLDPIDFEIELSDRYNNYRYKKEDELKNNIIQSNIELAEKNPLEYPEMYEENSQFDDYKTGKKYKVINDSWKEI